MLVNAIKLRQQGIEEADKLISRIERSVARRGLRENEGQKERRKLEDSLGTLRDENYTLFHEVMRYFDNTMEVKGYV